MVRPLKNPFLNGRAIKTFFLGGGKSFFYNVFFFILLLFKIKDILFKTTYQNIKTGNELLSPSLLKVCCNIWQKYGSFCPKIVGRKK